MPPVRTSDLLLHAGAYAVLGAALAFGRLYSHAAPSGAILLIAGSAHGAVSELYQTLVPGRYPAVSDWAADTVGVLLGYGLWVALAGLVTETKTTL